MLRNAKHVEGFVWETRLVKWHLKEVLCSSSNLEYFHFSTKSLLNKQIWVKNVQKWFFSCELVENMNIFSEKFSELDLVIARAGGRHDYSAWLDSFFVAIAMRTPRNRFATSKFSRLHWDQQSNAGFWRIFYIHLVFSLFSKLLCQTLPITCI